MSLPECSFQPRAPVALFGRNTGAQSWSFGVGDRVDPGCPRCVRAGRRSRLATAWAADRHRVTAGPSAVTVTFDAPADDGGSPIDSYLATCSSSDAGVGNTGTTTAALPVLVTGLTSGKTYTCVVAATSVAGQGADSAPSGVFVPLATVPGTPFIASIVAGDGNAAVNVHPPDDDSGTPITGYGASCTSTDFGAPANRRARPHPCWCVLTSNASYTYTATVTNGVGTRSRPTPSGPFVIPAPPVTGAISGTVTTEPADHADRLLRGSDRDLDNGAYAAAVHRVPMALTP